MRLHQGWIATIFSAILPGLGQLVNRDYKKFIIFLFADGLLYISNLLIVRPLLLTTEKITPFMVLRPEILIFLTISFIVWIISVEDAWRIGRRKARISDKKEKQTFLKKHFSNILIAILVLIIIASITPFILIYPHMSFEDGIKFNFCPGNCEDGISCTTDYCNASTNYTCVHTMKFPCCGNKFCENETEDCNSCPTDCGRCLREAHLEINYEVFDYHHLEKISEGEFSLTNQSYKTTRVRATIANRGDFDANITFTDFVCHSNGNYIREGETYNNVTLERGGEDIIKIQPGDHNRATIWFIFNWFLKEIPHFTTNCNLTIDWEKGDYVSNGFIVHF